MLGRGEEDVAVEQAGGLAAHAWTVAVPADADTDGACEVFCCPACQETASLRALWNWRGAAASSAPGCPMKVQAPDATRVIYHLSACNCEGRGGTAAAILPTGGGVSAKGSWGLASRHCSPL